MFNPFIINKFEEEGINVDLHSGFGIFFPWFSISISATKSAILTWIQTDKMAYAFDIAFSKKEADRLRKEAV